MRLISLLLVGAVVMGGVFALGAYRRSNDRHTCRAYSGSRLSEGPGRLTGEALPLSEQPEYVRAAVERCVEQRRAHRSGPFGAFVTTSDRAALSCERRWMRFGDSLGQGEPGDAANVLLSYGITDRLYPSNPADKERFMDACVPVRARELRQGGSD